MVLLVRLRQRGVFWGHEARGGAGPHRKGRALVVDLDPVHQSLHVEEHLLDLILVLGRYWGNKLALVLPLDLVLKLNILLLEFENFLGEFEKLYLFILIRARIRPVLVEFEQMLVNFLIELHV